MKVRVFDGPDLPSAIGAVRRCLGADALIIETRHIDRGVEILAAIETEETEIAPLEIPFIAEAYLDVRRESLAWHGVSEELTARLTEQDLAYALARRISFATVDPARDAAPLFFAGEPGAGKSLSLVKIATRFVMAGTMPMVISTDGRKAGATEQLAAMTRILGLTLVVADQPATLKRAITMRKDGEPVLVDGPGTAAHDPADDAMLRALVDAIEAEMILVVPAGLDRAETVDIALYHASIGATRMIATRLDVARRLGGIIEAAWRSRLPLAEAGTGPGVVDGMQSMTAQMVAARLEKTSQAVRPQEHRHSKFGGVYHGAK